MKLTALGGSLVVGGLALLTTKSPTTRQLLKPPARVGVNGLIKVIEPLGKQLTHRT